MFILLLYDLQLQFSVHTFYIEQAYKIDTLRNVINKLIHIHSDY